MPSGQPYRWLSKIKTKTSTLWSPFSNSHIPLCIAITCWILVAGLVLNAKATMFDVTKCGIDKVSGFYGPGSWGAWMFTVISCLIKRGFIGDDGRHSTLHYPRLGLDVDLIAAYAYPFIAAGDILTHLRHYVSSEVTEDDRGRLAASLLVVRSGAFFALFIVVVSIRGDRVRKTHRNPTRLNLGTFFALCAVVRVVSHTFIASTFGLYTSLRALLFLPAVEVAPEFAIPLSSASITDLDQMATLIVSGVIVLIAGVLDAVEANRETCSKVCAYFRDVLSRLFLYRIGNRQRNIAVNF